VIVSALKNADIFLVSNEMSSDACFGCDQEWYASEWQRISGCGPTAASNIIYYLSRTRPFFKERIIQNSKESCLSLMEELWEFVTPNEEGVDTTKKFCESMLMYLNSIGLHVAARVCDIPEPTYLRPELETVLAFLKQAMADDAPVAFLNLCSGEVGNLESWHWVTIVTIEYSGDLSRALAIILDEGTVKTIDLALWYNTTALGGGFVYFKTSED
jgi:hypothetical protein